MSGSGEDSKALEAILVGALIGLGALALAKILSDLDTSNKKEAEIEMRRRLKSGGR